MECIAYKCDYKYQLHVDYSIQVGLQPTALFDNGYLRLSLDGQLTISKGYAWDGPSGPTVDTRNFMRGALVHDALYQLMREGALDRHACRKTADEIMRRICREDGMSWLRSWWVYLAVRCFGDPAADPAHRKPVVLAPGGCSDFAPPAAPQP